MRQVSLSVLELLKGLTLVCDTRGDHAGVGSPCCCPRLHWSLRSVWAYVVCACAWCLGDVLGLCKLRESCWKERNMYLLETTLRLVDHAAAEYHDCMRSPYTDQGSCYHWSPCRCQWFRLMADVMLISLVQETQPKPSQESWTYPSPTSNTAARVINGH